MCLGPKCRTDNEETELTVYRTKQSDRFAVMKLFWCTKLLTDFEQWEVNLSFGVGAFTSVKEGDLVRHRLVKLNMQGLRMLTAESGRSG